MMSIHSHLVRTLSFTITGLVLCILVVTDLLVDYWIEEEFNRIMQTKVAMLMTLVNEDSQGVEFNFSAEYMPEFQGKHQPEYFQLWQKDKVFERSESLDLFTVKHLKFQDIAVGEKKVLDDILPDGRDGRIIYTRFLPQIDPKNRHKVKHSPTQTPMTLAYAVSVEKLNFIFWSIDIVFLVLTISVVIFVRLFVRKTIDNSLEPLDKLNADIKHLNIADTSAEINLDKPVKELIPIVQSLNLFITENSQLYLREKQLTSDIAHELKTPIAELINMAEVVIRFPDNKELEPDFKPEVLRISQRLKSIVSNLLLLNKYSAENLIENEQCDINQMLSKVIAQADLQRITLDSDQTIPVIVSNRFVLESIISNLMSNAKQYSPKASLIAIKTQLTQDNEIHIAISNDMSEPLTEKNLPYIFDPLWQQDSARTSNENFGLGLSIAKKLAQAIGGTLEVSLADISITFTLVIPSKDTDVS